MAPRTRSASCPPAREGLLNAIVLADSKGDPVQAAKILRGAVRRADASDPAVSEARDFLAELDERTSPPEGDRQGRMIEPPE
jgi:hypothetical protein